MRTANEPKKTGQGQESKAETKEKELGMAWRRRGRFLEVKINVLLDTTTALKSFRPLYEMEKCQYESRFKDKR